MHGNEPMQPDETEPSAYGVKTCFNELDQLGAEALEAKKAAISKWLDAGQKSARAFWEHVARRNGLAVGTWKFIAAPADVHQVLLEDHLFSVREYDRRMRRTSGRFYLGMDPPEHERDAPLGAFIPSWNSYRPGAAKDPAALNKVQMLADRACRKALASLGMNTKAARITNPEAPCRYPLPAIFGPVLDACSTAFFGLSGPSSLSLIAWAKDITFYHFRFYANEQEDRSCARIASGQYRAHVLSAIASLEHPPANEQEAQLQRIVDQLRKHSPGASNEDLANVLLNVLTGSITATYKAFDEGLRLYTAVNHDPKGRIAWPDLPPEGAGNPLYERVVANPLSAGRRGSLDTVYRTYVGKEKLRLGAVDLDENDRVIVWLGGTLTAQTQDNLFGIGVHKCPGMDMGKSIMEGALRALSQLRGADSPRLERGGETLNLVFDSPDALIQLSSQGET